MSYRTGARSGFSPSILGGLNMHRGKGLVGCILSVGRSSGGVQLSPYSRRAAVSLQSLRVIVAILYALLALGALLFLILVGTSGPHADSPAGTKSKLKSESKTGPPTEALESTVPTVSPGKPASLGQDAGGSPADPAAPRGGVPGDGTFGDQQVPSTRGRSRGGHMAQPFEADGASIYGSEVKQVSEWLIPILRAARDALRRHESELARKQLTEALSRTSLPEDKLKLTRWLRLCGVLDQFWKVMSSIVSSLEPLTTIRLSETEVMIVEASSMHLTLRVEGRNVTYSLRRIPPAVVHYLARQRFGQSPQSKVVLATYHAIDPRGDRRFSRELLLSAMAAGFDPGDFILEFPAFIDEQSIGEVIEAPTVSEQKAAMERLLGSGGPLSLSTVQHGATDTDSPTSESDSGRPGGDAESSESPVASRPAAKARLARQMLEDIRLGKVPARERLAVIDQARALATEAGDVQLLLACIDLEKRYRGIDPFWEAISELEKLAQSSDVELHRRIAVAALNLAADALNLKRPNTAERLLDIALESAYKCGNRMIIQEALKAKKFLEVQRR